MHILNGKQFSDRKAQDEVFDRAALLEAADKERKVPATLAGKILAAVFFEPSTRTRFSFTTAALKLGGQVITAENMGVSSTAAKGETLEDIARIVSGYADAIVMRHPENGAAERAARASEVPVVNAGDGTNEHPTQALLDIYTMRKELGAIDGKTLVFIGDHRSGRTLHSLLPMLTAYSNVRLILVSPKELRLPDAYKSMLTGSTVRLEEREDVAQILPETDILYVARIMKERFSSPEEYERLKDSYLTDTATLTKMKERSVVMAALPRVGEIDPAIDSDPRAAYFREARNGLYVRMALLEQVFSH